MSQKKVSESVLARRENGIALIFSLIVLVVLTLSGLALVRSVNTALMVAGNLSFQQGATLTADRGSENAIVWLQDNNTGSTLDSDNTGAGYLSSWQPQIDAGESWDAYWNRALAANAVSMTPLGGYTVAYVIQRMCLTTGPQAILNPCAQPQAVGLSSGSSKGSAVVQLQAPTQKYYRITSRAAGPRNSVSYIQVVVAL